jgi:uncharacterized ferredoxin-like protein
MAQFYEIHCYQENVFQYVVARTNKFSEEKVKKDVEQMNNMLSSELIRKGIRYVFAGGADVLIGYKHNRKKQNTDSGLDCNSVPNLKTCRTELTSSNANE